jgi:hypothetical protein
MGGEVIHRRWSKKSLDVIYHVYSIELVKEIARLFYGSTESLFFRKVP